MGSVLVVTQARRVKPLPALQSAGERPALGRPLFVFDELSSLFLGGRDRGQLAVSLDSDLTQPSDDTAGACRD